MKKTIRVNKKLQTKSLVNRTYESLSEAHAEIERDKNWKARTGTLIYRKGFYFFFFSKEKELWRVTPLGAGDDMTTKLLKQYEIKNFIVNNLDEAIDYAQNYKLKEYSPLASKPINP